MLIKHHALKAHTGVEIQIYSFLTSTLHFLDFHAKATRDNFYRLTECGTIYMNIAMIMGYSCKYTTTSKNLSRLQHLHILTYMWDWTQHNRQKEGIKIQLMSSISNSFESYHYITLKVTDIVKVNKPNKSLM